MADTTADSATADPSPAFDRRAVRPIFFGIMIGLALAAISQTLVTTALPTMVGELGGYSGLSWVVSAYLLTSTLVAPFAGKLADLHGTTRLFSVAIVVFAAGSLIAGVATSMAMLVAARAVQGIGGGAIMTLAFTLVAQIVPVRERGRYQGYVASMFAVTSVIGPLVGGFFVDHLSWRWAFYSNVVLAGVALLIVRRRLPADTGRRATGRADLAGAGLLVVTLTSTMLVAVLGGHAVPWVSPTMALLVAVAAGSAFAFVRCERRAEEPVVPLGLFRHRAVRASTTMGFFSGIAMFGIIVYTPTYLQVARGLDATRSGLLLVPFMGCILVGSTTAGRVMSATGRYRHLAVGGSALLLAGAALLATVDRSTPVLMVSLCVGLAGSGIGLTMPVTMVAVQDAVGPDDLGAATSMSQTTRKIGSMLGVAVLGGVFASRVSAGLEVARPNLPAGMTTDDLLDTPAEIAQLPSSAAEAVRDAVADGATVVFALAAVAAAVALVASLRMRDERLAEQPERRPRDSARRGAADPP